MKDIAEYLKYYVGQECRVGTMQDVYGLESAGTEESYVCLIDSDGFDIYKNDQIKLVLKRLRDITDEDKRAVLKINNLEGAKNALPFQVNRNVDFYFKKTNFEVIHYLLLQGYWLFGDEAFDEGLIIDSKTIN